MKRKHPSVRDIVVAPYRDGDEETWLRDAFHREGALILPLRNSAGEIRSLEFISAEAD